MVILENTKYCSTSHLRAFLTILFTVFALRIASAQPLSVSPVSFDLGRFPAWKSQAQTFTARNTGESTVNLLRVHIGGGTGDLSKAVFLEGDVRRLTSSRHRQAHRYYLEGVQK